MKKKNKSDNKLLIINNKKYIILFISLLLFVILTYYIFNNKINYLDTSIQDLMISIRSDNLTNIITIITDLGSPYTLITITVLLFFINKNKRIPILITLNLICSAIISKLVVFLSKRNSLLEASLIAIEEGSSYKAGHPMISIAFYMYLSYLIYKSTKNKIFKSCIIALLFILIIMISFSHIYLGTYYLSDILSSLLLSISYLMLFISITKNYLEKVK